MADGEKSATSGSPRSGATDSGGATSADASDETEDAAGPVAGPGGSREVEVPREVYKVVTVFSTLLSVLLVVLGFSVLNEATTVLRNPPGSTVGKLAVLAGLSTRQVVASASTLALVVGLVGLALVAAGAGVYVYGTRFRAPGMGKPKDEADEPRNDG